MGEYDTNMNCPYCGKELIIELYGSATKVLYDHLIRKCKKYNKKAGKKGRTKMSKATLKEHLEEAGGKRLPKSKKKR